MNIVSLACRGFWGFGYRKNPAKVESGLSGNADVKVKTWGTRIFWSGVALFVLAFFLYQEAVKIYPGLDESWLFGFPNESA